MLLYLWPKLCPATHPQSQPHLPVWSALLSRHCCLHLLLKVKSGTACLHEKKAQWNHGISTLLILVKGCILIDKETEAPLGFKSCSELSYVDWASDLELVRYSSLKLLEDTYPCIFHIPGHFANRGTDNLCPELSFQRYLYSRYPWKVEMASHSGAKRRFCLV